MNIKYFSIYESSEYITIKNNFTREALNIYYKGLQMTHFKEHIEINKKLLECDGIIGIINVNNFNYLVFISESEEIFSFDYCEIYKITNVGFISLDSLPSEILIIVCFLFSISTTKLSAVNPDKSKSCIISVFTPLNEVLTVSSPSFISSLEIVFICQK